MKRKYKNKEDRANNKKSLIQYLTTITKKQNTLIEATKTMDRTIKYKHEIKKKFDKAITQNVNKKIRISKHEILVLHTSK